MSRSCYKHPFFKSDLVKTKPNRIKIYNKNFIILPEYIHLLFRVYNGINFIPLRIKPAMIGFKFGEFIFTRKNHIYKKKKKK